MTVEIPLSQGKAALIDDGDVGLVEGYRWHAVKIGNNWYASTCRRVDGKPKTTYMHRLILPDAKIVDHINHDGLDNRRDNLRACDRNGQNIAAARFVHSVSGYRGVRRHPNAGRVKPYQARIKVNGKTIYLGYFATPEDAARAYDEAARHHFGGFAAVNFDT